MSAEPQEFRLYNTATDCGLYLTKDGAICFAWDGVEIGYREFLNRVHAMKTALKRIADEEHGADFTQIARDALHWTGS